MSGMGVELLFMVSVRGTRFNVFARIAGGNIGTNVSTTLATNPSDLQAGGIPANISDTATF